MGKTKRFCLMCHQVGIRIEFDNGNQLRRHVRDRHPTTASEVARRREQLRIYRKNLILQQQRLYRRD